MLRRKHLLHIASRTLNTIVNVNLPWNVLSLAFTVLTSDHDSLLIVILRRMSSISKISGTLRRNILSVICVNILLLNLGANPCAAYISRTKSIVLSIFNYAFRYFWILLLYIIVHAICVRWIVFLRHEWICSTTTLLVQLHTCYTHSFFIRKLLLTLFDKHMHGFSSNYLINAVYLCVVLKSLGNCLNSDSLVKNLVNLRCSSIEIEWIRLWNLRPWT